MAVALSDVSQHASPPKTAVALAVVPGRRRVAWLFVTLMMVVTAAMGGTVFLNTRLAERQIKIDQLDGDVRDQQKRFEQLRARRAELRSPIRLADEASKLGMFPAGESDFVAVNPSDLAVVIAASGRVDGIDSDTIAGHEPLDQHRYVKQITAQDP